MAAPAANAQTIAKQPPVFEYGEKFELWYQQFSAYCTICGVTPENKYNSFITFLSQRSFSIVNNLALTDAQKQNMDEENAFKLVRNALRTQKSSIPSRIQLQNRFQKQDESLPDYMFALENLANSAYPGTDNVAVRTTTVVDQFCVGVLDKDVSIELLKNTYPTAAEALTDAHKFTSAYEIRNLRLGDSSSHNVEILVSEVNRPNNYRDTYNYGSDRYSKDYSRDYNYNSRDNYNYSRDQNYKSNRGQNDKQGEKSQNSGQYYNKGQYNPGHYSQNTGQYYNRGQYNTQNSDYYKPQNSNYYNRPTDYRNSTYRADPRKLGQYRPPKRCFTCNQLDHVAAFCKANIECHKCHQLGHYRYE